MASFHESLRRAFRQHGITEVMLCEIEETIPTQELWDITSTLQQHMVPGKNGLILDDSDRTKVLVKSIAKEVQEVLAQRKTPQETEQEK